MWGAFQAWCLAQDPPVSLATLDSRHLSAFQAARYGMKNADQSLTPRHALRLLRLIDRVLRHQAWQSGTAPNLAAFDWMSAQPDIRFAESSYADPVPEFFSVAEARRLIVFLSQVLPQAEPAPVVQSGWSWQDARNRCAMALQLGAGLAPGDVRALGLASLDWRSSPLRRIAWIRVPGNGNLPPRDTPVADWAAELLAHWLRVRGEAEVQGPFLFPSTRSGKAWSKESQYKISKALLKQAGLDAADGGSFRLRHTFALRQLQRGTPAPQVAKWLGIDPAAMEKYQRLLSDSPEVV